MTEPKTIFFQAETGENGTLCFPMFDSRVAGTEWGLLRVELISRTEGQIVTVRCAESKRGPWQIIRLPVAETMLLYGYVGRYLKIDAAAAGVFRSGSITYPKAPFSDYLPAVYHGNPVLERYFAIFETRYLELEERIARYPRELTADTASPEALDWLSGLYGLPSALCEQLGRPVQRRLLRHALLITRLKGSSACWRLLVWLAAGRRCVVADNNPAIVLVLGPLPPSLPKSVLIALLEWYRPLGVRLRVKILEYGAGIGENLYLGVNTLLPAAIPAVLGQALLCGGHYLSETAAR